MKSYKTCYKCGAIVTINEQGKYVCKKCGEIKNPNPPGWGWK